MDARLRGSNWMTRARFIFVVTVIFVGVAHDTRASTIQMFTDRGEFYKAAAAAGITLGVETFQGARVGAYSGFFDVNFATFGGTNVAASGSNHFWRSFEGMGFGKPVRAVGFDILGIENVFGVGGFGSIIIAGDAGGLVTAPTFLGFISPAATIDRVSMAGGTFPLIDDIAYENGPTTSQANALGPSGACGLAGCSVFVGPQGPWWFDPLAANAYTFTTLDGGHFLSINDFPTGFNAPFVVSAGATILGSFEPGQSLQFPGGVTQFTISGISPTLNGDDPMAFPINLSLDTVGGRFSMQALDEEGPPVPVPEPASLILFATGGAWVIARNRWASR